MAKLKSNSSNHGGNEEDIIQFKNEISHLQQLVKTYEEHNLKIPELEKKLRSQKTKFEKEIKNIEAFYKEKIKSFNKKLSQYEDVLKNNNTNSSKLDRTNDDIDRVNYIPSRNPDISIHNRSRTHSQDNIISKPNTSRGNKPSTDRKKEIDYISTKIDQYKKGIDKKINEVRR